MSSPIIKLEKDESTRQDHTTRLKKKTMIDVKSGSPATKAICKTLFHKYQEMGRDATKYEDEMEMTAMYDENINLDEDKFDSLCVHCTFKSLEK